MEQEVEKQSEQQQDGQHELTGREKSNKAIEPFQFKKGQSGNAKGRPPLTVQSICKQLKKEGYKEFGKSDVSKVYLYCMSMGEERMKQLVNDKETPFIVRLCIKSLLSKKGFEYAEKMLDRSLGKVGDKLDITSGGEKLKHEPLTIEVIDKREQVDERIDG